MHTDKISAVVNQSVVLISLSKVCVFHLCCIKQIPPALSLCLSVCLSVCLYLSLSLCVSLSVSLSLCVCLCLVCVVLLSSRCVFCESSGVCFRPEEPPHTSGQLLSVFVLRGRLSSGPRWSRLYYSSLCCCTLDRVCSLYYCVVQTHSSVIQLSWCDVFITHGCMQTSGRTGQSQLSHSFHSFMEL